MKDRELPLEAHLEEIRNRLLVVILSLVVFSAVSFYFINDILEILKWPAGDALGKLAVFSPTAAILSFIKISLFGGLTATLPMLLYQVWMFIFPALDEKFSKHGPLFILVGSLLFLLGMVFSYFLLIPASLKFLMGVGRGELEFIISLDAYVSFVLFFLLGGGLVFEMPVLSFMLAKFGVLTAKAMISGWRIAVLAILILAAIITPTPDIVNMVLMSIPMFCLYLVSIFVTSIAEKK